MSKVWKERSSVVFNGDGYSSDWHEEAARRGLPNLETTVDALGVFIEPATISLFEKYGVLSARELESRYEVYAEQYIATANIESNLVLEMGRTQIFPAAIRYQSELALSLANLKAVGIETDHDSINIITNLIKNLQVSLDELEALKGQESAITDVAAHCQFVKSEVLTKMLDVRTTVDALEERVADDLWPLPTFQEMFFIR